MKSLFKLSAFATLLISVSSNAVTLDYRHEYKPESGTNADRIKIGHTTQDGYFASVEGRVSEKTETDSEGFKMVLRNTVAMAANLNLERTSLLMTNLR